MRLILTRREEGATYRAIASEWEKLRLRPPERGERSAAMTVRNVWLKRERYADALAA